MAFVPNTILTAEQLNAAFAEKAGAAETEAALAQKADKVSTQAAIDGLAQAVSGKQDQLASGENIKTLNNQSLLGQGNIEIRASIAKPYYFGSL